jgi:hypothetical protein
MLRLWLKTNSKRVPPLEIVRLNDGMIEVGNRFAPDITSASFAQSIYKEIMTQLDPL